MTTDRSCN